jgi:hypothetical protein
MHALLVHAQEFRPFFRLINYWARTIRTDTAAVGIGAATSSNCPTMGGIILFVQNVGSDGERRHSDDLFRPFDHETAKFVRLLV